MADKQQQWLSDLFLAHISGLPRNLAQSNIINLVRWSTAAGLSLINPRCTSLPFRPSPRTFLDCVDIVKLSGSSSVIVIVVVVSTFLVEQQMVLPSQHLLLLNPLY